MNKKSRQVGVFVDFTKYPDLHKALVSLADEEYTTPPALIRKMVSDGIQRAEEKPQKKNQVARSAVA
jgi:hypothetical protein